MWAKRPRFGCESDLLGSGLAGRLQGEDRLGQGQAQPQHTRMAAFGESADALDCDVDRRTGARGMLQRRRETRDRGAWDVAQEAQRQVQLLDRNEAHVVQERSDVLDERGDARPGLCFDFERDKRAQLVGAHALSKGVRPRISRRSISIATFTA